MIKNGEFEHFFLTSSWLSKSHYANFATTKTGLKIKHTIK